jgi:hypothetical protein
MKSLIYSGRYTTNFENHDRSVGIALGYGLDDRCSRVRFPAGAVNFSLHHRVQNGSGAHPVSCLMGTGALLVGVKRPRCEADHSPPSSAEIKEWVAIYVHSPNTPSWRGAQLKHRDNFTLTFYKTNFYMEPNSVMDSSAENHSSKYSASTKYYWTCFRVKQMSSYG